MADLGDVNTQYTMGLLNLEQRAWAEMLHQNTCLALKELLNPVNRNHRALADELSEKLADKCFANFSLFQSLPDAWGIGQVFPVMPLAGLERPLTRRGILMDITCDSDGQVEHYVDGLGSRAPCRCRCMARTKSATSASSWSVPIRRSWGSAQPVR